MAKNVELANTVMGVIYLIKQICHGTEGKTEKQIIVTKATMILLLKFTKRMNLEPKKI